jgi:hypothetical protein
MTRVTTQVKPLLSPQYAYLGQASGGRPYSATPLIDTGTARQRGRSVAAPSPDLLAIDESLDASKLLDVVCAGKRVEERR